jgi:hypothetical protein
MRRFLFCSLVVLLTLAAHAQNFEGQWKGSFTAYGSAERDEYVLELQVTGKTHVTGYSYTYFYANGLRYFTICTLEGTVDLAAKTVTVREVEKIKGNVPPGEMDCLQVHRLTYFKGEETETLEGTWKPAPGFDHGCGFGNTTLVRNMLASISPRPKSVPAPPPPPRKAPVPDGRKVTAKRPAAKTDTATVRAHRNPPKPSLATKPPLKPKPHTATTARDSALTMQSSGPRLSGPPTAAAPLTPPPPQVRQRNDNLVQTIELSSPEIQIELYDDGVIDHDTVTVYFNGKAVVYKAMLRHQPIRATLTALPDRDNDLILFADNLGDIPPNTALMVVHAGEEIYDVRITSDLQSNGLVRFRLKAKGP